MRAVFVVLALSVFTIARPFGGDISKVALRSMHEAEIQSSPEILGNVVGALKDAAKTQGKALLSDLAGKACDHVQGKLATREVDISDLESTVGAVADKMYEEWVAGHDATTLEDSGMFLKNLATALGGAVKNTIKGAASDLVGQGCEQVQAKLSA